MKTEVSNNKNAFGDYFEECFVKKAATFLISFWKSPEYIFALGTGILKHITAAELLVHFSVTLLGYC